MNPENQATNSSASTEGQVSVKIFGIGGAGVAMIERMIQEGFAGASYAAVNTDAKLLDWSSASEKILLESRPTRGLGTGGDPERGSALAEEQLPKLKDACGGADVVFIVAGLGGGAGTGIGPVLARTAKSAGALVLAFVTLPFDCEGNRRQRAASRGLDQLRAEADGVICLPNQKMFHLLDENVSVLDAFETTTNTLIEGARGVWRLLAHTGLIQIHFADLCALLRNRHGESCFATVEAAGPDRSHQIVEKLTGHPMLNNGQALTEAEAVLVSLLGGPDLAMADVHRVMEQINRQCEHAQVIMGAAIDESFRGRLAVTLITTQHVHGREPGVAPTETHTTAPDLNAQLLDRKTEGRPPSRFVPPAPALTPEQRDQIISQQTGSRPSRSKPRLRQSQLPLEIINKGRFDKSEPTIHKGEDLDVPTYIRRGVALN